MSWKPLKKMAWSKLTLGNRGEIISVLRQKLGTTSVALGLLLVGGKEP